MASPGVNVLSSTKLICDLANKQVAKGHQSRGLSGETRFEVRETPNGSERLYVVVEDKNIDIEINDKTTVGKNEVGYIYGDIVTNERYWKIGVKMAHNLFGLNLEEKMTAECISQNTTQVVFQVTMLSAVVQELCATDNGRTDSTMEELLAAIAGLDVYRGAITKVLSCDSSIRACVPAKSRWNRQKRQNISHLVDNIRNAQITEERVIIAIKNYCSSFAKRPFQFTKKSPMVQEYITNIYAMNARITGGDLMEKIMMDEPITEGMEITLDENSPLDSKVKLYPSRLMEYVCQVNGITDDELSDDKTPPVIINVGTELELVVKNAFENFLKNPDNKNKYQDLKAQGKSNDPLVIKMDRYDAIISASKDHDTMADLTTSLLAGVASYGFNAFGEHYILGVFSNGAFRTGTAVAVLDKYELGWLLFAILAALSTNMPNARREITRVYNKAMDDIKNIPAFPDMSRYEHEKWKILKNYGDQLLEKMTDTVDGFYKNANKETIISQALGRLALANTTRIMDIKKLCENNEYDTVQQAYEMLKSYEIGIVENPSDISYTAEKLYTLTPVKKPLGQSTSGGRTHNAVITVEDNVTRYEPPLNGNTLVGLTAMVCIGHTRNEITPDEFTFWVDNYKGTYDCAFEKLEEMAKTGDAIAKELVRIAKIVTSMYQVRMYLAGYKGTLQESDFNHFEHTDELMINGKPVSQYQAITTRESVKTLPAGQKLTLADLQITMVSKAPNPYEAEHSMTAQYMGNTTLNIDQSHEITDYLLDRMREIVTNPKWDSKLGGKGQKAIQTMVDRLVYFGFITKDTGDSLARFMSEPARLAKTNLAWTNSREFHAEIYDKITKDLTKFMVGKIPVNGFYAMIGEDDREAMNALFKEQMEAKGFKPYKTLQDYAKDQNIKGTPVFFNDYDKEKCLTNRSPALTKHEANIVITVKMPGMSFFTGCVLMSVASGLPGRLSGCDFDGDKILIMLCCSIINQIIMGAVKENEIELDIDPGRTNERAGINNKNYAKLTATNIILTVVEHLRRTKVGQICNNGMGFMMLGDHLTQVLELFEKFKKEGKAKRIRFVAHVDGYRWTNIPTGKDKELQAKFESYEKIHEQCVEALLSEKDPASMMKALSFPSDFVGYYFNEKTKELIVEGYIEHFYDRKNNCYKPSVNRDDKTKYVGLYGVYEGNDETIHELEKLRDFFYTQNRVNNVAQSMAVDGPKNGFSSYFETQVPCLDMQRAFAIKVKGSSINKRLLHASFFSLNALGVIALDIAKSWLEIIDHLSEDKGVDLTTYLFMLVQPSNVVNIMFKYPRIRSFLERKHAEYVQKYNEITATYKDKGEEYDTYRDKDFSILNNKMRNSILNAIDLQLTMIDKKVIAALCYAIGRNDKFKYVLIDELILAIKNDPTAIGVAELPHKFNNKTDEAIIKYIGTQPWVCTIRNGVEHGHYMISAYIPKGSTFVRPRTVRASNGHWYVLYQQIFTNNQNPRNRCWRYNEDIELELQEDSIMLYGTEICGADNGTKLRNAFGGNTMAGKVRLDKDLKPYFEVEKDGVVYKTGIKLKNTNTSTLNECYLPVLMSFLVNHPVVLDITKCTVTNGKTTTYGNIKLDSYR